MLRSAVTLPPPLPDAPLLRALAARRTQRDFADTALTLAELGMLLWAAQGVTHRDGRRAAPSAGALYPLELLAVAGAVTGLAPGVYRYRPADHALRELAGGDRRASLARAAHGQDWLAGAAAVLVYAAVYRRTTGKYGERGRRYVHIEIGHAAENVSLLATAAGLATAEVGAFDDTAVRALLQLPDEEMPLYLQPVGRAAD